MTGVLEDREETLDALLTEDEITMCESRLDDEEDLDKDSADEDNILADDSGGDKTDSAPVSVREYRFDSPYRRASDRAEA